MDAFSSYIFRVIMSEAGFWDTANNITPETLYK